MNVLIQEKIGNYIFNTISKNNQDIDGVIIEHYIRNADLKEFEFIYSTYNKDGKRNNDYQSFKLTFEQFESLIKNGKK